MHRAHVWLCGLVFLMGASAFAQKATLYGQLRDTTGQAVAYGNVIARPYGEGAGTTFSISTKEGQYRLKLEKGVRYHIQITSIGFAPLTDSLRIRANTQKDYTLHRSTSQLEQVVVKAKMAMIVKKDTITYRVDQFRTGDERKLRALLKKLPGVDVDREGNVMVNGKKVTRLLVDGKPFFGGNVKLGVNNIPADAVEEVVALDDYHEVAFMKGLADSDRMAMNIKLKEDKKNFVFGQNEAGGGFKNRYYLHPTLFYYSAKTTVNFIGSINNVNESPLDFDDVVRFKGGYGNFTDNPVNSSDAGLSRFSSSGDILHKKTIFGAVNLSQQITPELRMTAYSIVGKKKSKAKRTEHTEYLTQDNLTENRLTSTRERGLSNFNKIRLRYRPGIKKDLAYDVIANISNGDFSQGIRSRFADSTSHINSSSAPHQTEISQYLRYNTQPSYLHTSKINAFYTYKETDNLHLWQFDHPVFPSIIPAAPSDGSYNFLHDYSSVTNTGKINFKHYWVLNNTNHIYPVTGLYFYHQTYNSHDFQRLQDGSTRGFKSAGFDNALGFQLIAPYLGLQYKFKLGELVFEPGLVYHHYIWHVDQFGKRIADKDKGLFLPEFKLEYDRDLTKLVFDYALKASFADASSYANRLRLTGFNTLYRGNETLENALYHRLSLTYRAFDRLRGYNYSIRLNYKRQEKSIRHATSLEDISQVVTSIYSELPENRYRFSGLFTKRWQDYVLGITLKTVLSNYSRRVNDKELSYKSSAYGYGAQVRTRFKALPNITLGLRQIYRQYTARAFKNKFWTFNPIVRMDYAFLNGLIFKADYNYRYTKDNSSAHGQKFQIADASLFYRAEDSPWGFEVRAENVFDVQYKRSHYLNEFMIYDQRTYIQPRTILFILSYQL